MSLSEAQQTVKTPELLSCKFCEENDPDALEEHHIVPRRYNGSDKEENIVKVCASCHRKLESLYNNRFYEKVQDKEYECPYCGMPHRGFEDHKEHTMQCNEHEKVRKIP